MENTHSESPEESPTEEDDHVKSQDSGSSGALQFVISRGSELGEVVLKSTPEYSLYSDQELPSAPRRDLSSAYTLQLQQLRSAVNKVLELDANNDEQSCLNRREEYTRMLNAIQELGDVMFAPHNRSTWSGQQDAYPNDTLPKRRKSASPGVSSHIHQNWISLTEAHDQDNGLTNEPVKPHGATPIKFSSEYAVASKGSVTQNVHYFPPSGTEYSLPGECVKHQPIEKKDRQSRFRRTYITNEVIRDSFTNSNEEQTFSEPAVIDTDSAIDQLNVELSRRDQMIQELSGHLFQIWEANDRIFADYESQETNLTNQLRQLRSRLSEATQTLRRSSRHDRHSVPRQSSSPDLMTSPETLALLEFAKELQARLVDLDKLLTSRECKELRNATVDLITSWDSTTSEERLAKCRRLLKVTSILIISSLTQSESCVPSPEMLELDARVQLADEQVAQLSALVDSLRQELSQVKRVSPIVEFSSSIPPTQLKIDMSTYDEIPVISSSSDPQSSTNELSSPNPVQFVIDANLSSSGISPSSPELDISQTIRFGVEHKGSTQEVLVEDFSSYNTDNVNKVEDDGVDLIRTLKNLLNAKKAELQSSKPVSKDKIQLEINILHNAYEVLAEALSAYPLYPSASHVTQRLHERCICDRARALKKRDIGVLTVGGFDSFPVKFWRQRRHSHVDNGFKLQSEQQPGILKPILKRHTSLPRTLPMYKTKITWDDELDLLRNRLHNLTVRLQEAVVKDNGHIVLRFPQFDAPEGLFNFSMIIEQLEVIVQHACNVISLHTMNKDRRRGHSEINRLSPQVHLRSTMTTQTSDSKADYREKSAHENVPLMSNSKCSTPGRGTTTLSSPAGLRQIVCVQRMRENLWAIRNIQANLTSQVNYCMGWMRDHMKYLNMEVGKLTKYQTSATAITQEIGVQATFVENTLLINASVKSGKSSHAVMNNFPMELATGAIAVECNECAVQLVDASLCIENGYLPTDDLDAHTNHEQEVALLKLRSENGSLKAQLNAANSEIDALTSYLMKVKMDLMDSLPKREASTFTGLLDNIEFQAIPQLVTWYVRWVQESFHTHNTQLEQSKSANLQLQRELDSVKAQMATTESRFRSLRRQYERQRELATASGVRASVEAEMEAQTIALMSTQVQSYGNTSFTASVSQSHADMRESQLRQYYESVIAQLQSDATSNSDMIYRMQQTLEAYGYELEKSKSHVDQLCREREAYMKQNNSQSETIAQLQTELTHLSALNQPVTIKYSTVQHAADMQPGSTNTQQASDLLAELKQSEQALAAIKQELHVVSAAKEELEEQVKSLTGDSYSVLAAENKLRLSELNRQDLEMHLQSAKDLLEQKAKNEEELSNSLSNAHAQIERMSEEITRLHQLKDRLESDFTQLPTKEEFSRIREQLLAAMLERTTTLEQLNQLIRDRDDLVEQKHALENELLHSQKLLAEQNCKHEQLRSEYIGLQTAYQQARNELEHYAITLSEHVDTLQSRNNLLDKLVGTDEFCSTSIHCAVQTETEIQSLSETTCEMIHSNDLLSKQLRVALDQLSIQLEGMRHRDQKLTDLQYILSERERELEELRAQVQLEKPLVNDDHKPFETTKQLTASDIRAYSTSSSESDEVSVIQSKLSNLIEDRDTFMKAYRLSEEKVQFLQGQLLLFTRKLSLFTEPTMQHGQDKAKDDEVASDQARPSKHHVSGRHDVDGSLELYSRQSEELPYAHERLEKLDEQLASMRHNMESSLRENEALRAHVAMVTDECEQWQRRLADAERHESARVECAVTAAISELNTRLESMTAKHDNVLSAHARLLSALNVLDISTRENVLKLAQNVEGTGPNIMHLDEESKQQHPVLTFPESEETSEEDLMSNIPTVKCVRPLHHSWSASLIYGSMGYSDLFEIEPVRTLSNGAKEFIAERGRPLSTPGSKLPESQLSATTSRRFSELCSPIEHSLTLVRQRLVNSINQSVSLATMLTKRDSELRNLRYLMSAKEAELEELKLLHYGQIMNDSKNAMNANLIEPNSVKSPILVNSSSMLVEKGTTTEEIVQTLCAAEDTNRAIQSKLSAAREELHIKSMEASSMKQQISQYSTTLSPLVSCSSHYVLEDLGVSDISVDVCDNCLVKIGLVTRTLSSNEDARKDCVAYLCEQLRNVRKEQTECLLCTRDLLEYVAREEVEYSSATQKNLMTGVDGGVALANVSPYMSSIQTEICLLSGRTNELQHCLVRLKQLCVTKLKASAENITMLKQELLMLTEEKEAFKRSLEAAVAPPVRHPVVEWNPADRYPNDEDVRDGDTVLLNPTSTSPSYNHSGEVPCTQVRDEISVLDENEAALKEDSQIFEEPFPPRHMLVSGSKLEATSERVSRLQNTLKRKTQELCETRAFLTVIDSEMKILRQQFDTISQENNKLKEQNRQFETAHKESQTSNRYQKATFKDVSTWTDPSWSVRNLTVSTITSFSVNVKSRSMDSVLSDKMDQISGYSSSLVAVNKKQKHRGQLASVDDSSRQMNDYPMVTRATNFGSAVRPINTHDMFDVRNNKCKSVETWSVPLTLHPPFPPRQSHYSSDLEKPSFGIIEEQRSDLPVHGITDRKVEEYMEQSYYKSRNTTETEEKKIKTAGKETGEAREENQEKCRQIEGKHPSGKQRDNKSVDTETKKAQQTQTGKKKTREIEDNEITEKIKPPRVPKNIAPPEETKTGNEQNEQDYAKRKEQTRKEEQKQMANQPQKEKQKQMTPTEERCKKENKEGNQTHAASVEQVNELREALSASESVCAEAKRTIAHQSSELSEAAIRLERQEADHDLLSSQFGIHDKVVDEVGGELRQVMHALSVCVSSVDALLSAADVAQSSGASRVSELESCVCELQEQLRVVRESVSFGSAVPCDSLFSGASPVFDVIASGVSHLLPVSRFPGAVPFPAPFRFVHFPCVDSASSFVSPNSVCFSPGMFPDPSFGSSRFSILSSEIDRLRSVLCDRDLEVVIFSDAVDVFAQCLPRFFSILSDLRSRFEFDLTASDSFSLLRALLLKLPMLKPNVFSKGDIDFFFDSFSGRLTDDSHLPCSLLIRNDIQFNGEKRFITENGMSDEILHKRDSEHCMVLNSSNQYDAMSSTSALHYGEKWPPAEISTACFDWIDRSTLKSGITEESSDMLHDSLNTQLHGGQLRFSLTGSSHVTEEELNQLHLTIADLEKQLAEKDSELADALCELRAQRAELVTSMNLYLEKLDELNEIRAENGKLKDTATEVERTHRFQRAELIKEADSLRDSLQNSENEFFLLKKELADTQRELHLVQTSAILREQETDAVSCKSEKLLSELVKLRSEERNLRKIITFEQSERDQLRHEYDNLMMRFTETVDNFNQMEKRLVA
ncbi:hypothetical protein EG68_08710, partial [Paragonimus skrjabini miyazakii]